MPAHFGRRFNHQDLRGVHGRNFPEKTRRVRRARETGRSRSNDEDVDIQTIAFSVLDSLQSQGMWCGKERLVGDDYQHPNHISESFENDFAG